MWYFDILEAEKYEISEKDMLDAIETALRLIVLSFPVFARSKGWLLGGLRTLLVPFCPETIRKYRD